MKVTILTEPSPEDKPNLRARRQSQALAEAGHDPETLSVTLVGNVPKHLLGRIAYHREKTRSLAKAAIDAGPDLVIAHDIYTLDAGVQASYEFGIPLIYDSHEDWTALIGEHSLVEAMAAKFIERRAAGRVSHALVPSAPIGRRLESMGIPTTVTYNARSIEEIKRMHKAEARQKVGLNQDSFVVGYIGAMEQLLKGRVYDRVFDAVARLPSQVELVVIGGPVKDAEALASLADEGDLGIHILGPMGFDELAPYYSSLDAGLVALDETRRNYYNSLPNKLFDYMAFGVPALVPPFPDMSDIVTTGKCGIPYTNLEEAIRRMMAMDDVERNRMSYGAYETFAQHSWNAQAPKFVRLCESYT